MSDIKPFDPSKPCTTRDGRKARILCADAPGLLSVIAVIGDKNYVTMFHANGGLCSDGQSVDDLVNIPDLRWLAFYLSANGTELAQVCKSKSAAEVFLRQYGNSLGLIEIEWPPTPHQTL